MAKLLRILDISDGMAKRNRFKTDNLCRFMVYILGHSPDEFGLVPDREGFVTYKELLWAIHEEEGWGYVRQGHINEVLLGKDRSLFQPEDKRIRALDRRWYLDMDSPSQSLPKILFITIRRRAHPAVMEKGLRANPDLYHILSPDRDMAVRIGRRRDQRPVLLEVNAHRAQRSGVLFFSFGNLFMTDEIPAGHISGPPVPKETLKIPIKKPDKKPEIATDFQAGSFTLDVNRDMDASRRHKSKKGKGWKEDARKYRREKRK